MKAVVIILLVFVALALTACMQSSDCFQENVFCVGLVTDTLGINDHGMNQDTWAGLQEAKANKLVDQVEYIESVDSRDYEKNITYFAEKGFDVIVTTNPGMRDETLRSADLYPDSAFIGINQPHEESRPNITPITFPEDQMGFLAGALAARISETQVIGAVCETSGIDSMWRYCEGFRAGALFASQLMSQNVKALVIYREDGDSEKLFVDEEWGYDTAHGLIQRGVDVIFAAGGVTGQGALRAASDSSASLRAGLRVRAIGAERDQRVVLEGEGSGVVTSILGNASFEVQEVLRLLRKGKVYQPRPGKIKYVPFERTFPESLTREMDTLLFSLWNGEVKTNVTLTRPK